MSEETKPWCGVVMAALRTLLAAALALLTVLALMLGLRLEEPVLRGAVEKLAGAELVPLRDALRERAAERYPIQLQLGTVRGEAALESAYLI